MSNALLTRIDNIGISAFGDRRSQASFQIQQPKPQTITISLKKDDQLETILYKGKIISVLKKKL